MEWRRSRLEIVDDSRVNSRMKMIISNCVVVTIACTVRVCIVKSKILNLYDVVMNGQILIWLQNCFHHLNHFLKRFSIRYSPVYEVLTPGKGRFISPLWFGQS